jgi:protein SCO1/2
MKKFGKAGLLIFTLVIPALVFTFLRFFATNHYNVPIYHPLTDGEGEVRVSGKDTLFYTVPDIQDLSFKGGLTVVSNWAKQCDDTCQIMRDNLNRIYALREGIRGLSLISLTDSVSSSVESENKIGWQFASLDSIDQNRILKWNDLRDIDKSGSFQNRWILIDENGHIRGYYNGADAADTDRLMAEIKILSVREKDILK